MAWRVRMRYGGYNDRLLGEVARKRREGKYTLRAQKNYCLLCDFGASLCGLCVK